MNVDGLQVEGLVTDMYRQISRAIRTFQEFPSNLIIWWLPMKVQNNLKIICKQRWCQTVTLYIILIITFYNYIKGNFKKC